MTDTTMATTDNQSLLNAANKIAELVRQYNAVEPSDSKEYVSAGLMTEVEYEQYKAYEAIKEQAYQAGKTAESQVSYSSDGLPAEYAALDARLTAVRAELVGWVMAINGIEQLVPGRGQRGLYEVYQLGQPAKRLWQALGSDPRFQALVQEKAELEAKMAPKEREGTIVHRVRRANFGKLAKAQAAARQTAHNAVLEANSSVVEVGKSAEAYKDYRVDARKQELVKQMEEVLSDF